MPVDSWETRYSNVFPLVQAPTKLTGMPRRILISLLILQMLHLPLPCPDLDGECRGTPIESLNDSNAWHVVITGIKPNDDVDLGPFRSDHSERKNRSADSPYGDLALSSASVTVAQDKSTESVDLIRNVLALSALTGSQLATSCRAFSIPQGSFLLDARTLRVKSCIWLI